MGTEIVLSHLSAESNALIDRGFHFYWALRCCEKGSTDWILPQVWSGQQQLQKWDLSGCDGEYRSIWVCSCDKLGNTQHVPFQHAVKKHSCFKQIPDDHLAGCHIYPEADSPLDTELRPDGAGLPDTDFLLYLHVQTTDKCRAEVNLQLLLTYFFTSVLRLCAPRVAAQRVGLRLPLPDGHQWATGGWGGCHLLGQTVEGHL